MLENPLPLTSIASKFIHSLGLHQIRDLWDFDFEPIHGNLPKAIFTNPTLCMQNSFRHLLSKLKVSGDFDIPYSRYMRIILDFADLILDIDVVASKAFLSTFIGRILSFNHCRLHLICCLLFQLQFYITKAKISGSHCTPTTMHLTWSNALLLQCGRQTNSCTRCSHAS